MKYLLIAVLWGASLMFVAQMAIHQAREDDQAIYKPLYNECLAELRSISGMYSAMMEGSVVEE